MSGVECVTANNGKSICSGAAGRTIPVNAPFGQMRFQFNGSGNLERRKNCALGYYGIDPLSISGATPISHKINNLEHRV